MAGAMNVPMTQVEISISCKNLRDRDALSKSDPMAVVFLKEVSTGRFIEIGRTERVKNNLNPEFAKKIQVDYFFEEAQKLKFEIYDIDSETGKLSAHDFLGRIECTLGEIVGAPGSKIHRALSGSTRQSGSIAVSAEEIGSSKEVVVLQFNGQKLDKKDFMGKSDPFLTIYRINEDNTQTLAFRSEVIKNNLNPVWRPFKVPVRQLCGPNQDRPIRIECADYDNDGGHDLIGVCQTTFRQLMQGQGPSNSYDLINPKKQSHKKGYKNSGLLQLMRVTVHTEYSFLDYIRGGTQIHFTVAVDFTASNGNPMNPQSLHYIHPYTPNQYMMALRAVGEICQDYNTSKLFPALGFGAKLPNGQVSHQFFLNFHPSDPHCQGVEGILDAYRRAIMSLSLYGPTNFSPVINHVSTFAAAAARDGSHYFVLLIITDGVISDFEQTKAAIVNASSLPMSIIIVGVGNDEFEAMDALDSDKYKLSSHGRVAERDIVQFVPFRNYVRGNNCEYSQAALSKDVLKEVPGQLTAWMQARNIQPRPPQQVNIENIPVQPPPTDPNQQPPQGGQSGHPQAGGNVPPTDQMQQMNIGGQQPYPPQNVATAAPYPQGGPGQYPSHPQQGGTPSPYPPGSQGPAAAPYPSSAQPQQAGTTAPYSTAPQAGHGASYPQYGGAAPYPPTGQASAPTGPHPGQGGAAPYPPTGQASAPTGSHPGQGGAAPYPPTGQASAPTGPHPGQGGAAPYPPTGQASAPTGPHPGQGGAAPYPPTGQASAPTGPHPGQGGAAPYPPMGQTATAAPYPGQTGHGGAGMYPSTGQAGSGVPYQQQTAYAPGSHGGYQQPPQGH